MKASKFQYQRKQVISTWINILIIVFRNKNFAPDSLIKEIRQFTNGAKEKLKKKQMIDKIMDAKYMII